jgi:hypothetical protein
MVGGLVEEQEVRLLEQQLAQRDATALAPGEVVDHLVRRGAPQGIHGLREARVEIPGVGMVEIGLQLTHLGEQGVVVGVGVGERLADGVETVHLPLDRGDRLLDVLEHRLALGQGRLLQQDADGRLGILDGVAVVGVLQPRHDLEQRRLASAVGPDDADLGTVQERQGDVVEHELLAKLLANVAEGEYVVGHPTTLTTWR